ncbi:MAG TPA: DsbA family protein, partial [Kofleriaceae bacterium]|nr:DsbA family protein [Kofleriaceae bacterium]
PVIITKRLKAKAIATWLGPTGDAARKAFANVKERVTSAPRRLDFYYDLSDPWSYLTAQAVQRLIDAYPIELAFHVITPPASDVDPAPLLRATHAIRDALQLADYWDIEFPGTKPADSGLVRDVGTALVRERPARDQLRCALELGVAMWTIDRKGLMKLLGQWGTESHIEVPPIMNGHYNDLRKAGHYNGAMLAYKGEWYWGIDRLPYLESELAKDLGVDVAHVVTPRADRAPQPLSDKPLTAEMWLSFRSPYSYLALEQIEAILAPYNIPLVLKPVLPMVTRGLAVPNVKRMYIVRDAKREADRLGIPFGELCDPLGKGVEHCIAIAHWAQSKGALIPFVKSAMRGIWSEGKDVSEYVDLRAVVERAGLSWDEAKAQLDDPTGLKAANESVAEMAVISLWGVPSIRVGNFIAWGQDRLPLLADRLRRAAILPT